MNDPKLSNAQKKALSELGKREGSWVPSGYRRIRTNTLNSLRDLGLVERRLDYWLGYEYRITRSGLELLGTKTRDEE